MNVWNIAVYNSSDTFTTLFFLISNEDRLEAFIKGLYNNKKGTRNMKENELKKEELKEVNGGLISQGDGPRIEERGPVYVASLNNGLEKTSNCNCNCGNENKD